MIRVIRFLRKEKPLDKEGGLTSYIYLPEKRMLIPGDIGSKYMLECYLIESRGACITTSAIHDLQFIEKSLAEEEYRDGIKSTSAFETETARIDNIREFNLENPGLENRILALAAQANDFRGNLIKCYDDLEEERRKQIQKFS